MENTSGPDSVKNSRVLKWIFERCEGSADAEETPIGNLPTMDSLDLSGIDLDSDEIAQLLSVEIEGWLSEIPLIEAYYTQYGDRVPQALRQELNKSERTP